MGAYSTMDITRPDAVAVITARLLNASDEELENVLFDLFGDKHLSNFQVVSDYSGAWPYKFRASDIGDWARGD